MSPEGMTKIKSKFQELVTLVKEETAGDTHEIKEDILNGLDKVKVFFEERMQVFDDRYGENIDGILGALEGKANSVKNTLQEKLSKGVAQKEDLLGKAADTLSDAMNKLKEKITPK